MKLDLILSKLYKQSSMVIVPIVLLTCFVCKWPLLMMAVALLASIVISSPAIISLQLLVWVFQKLRFDTGFVWMLLLASIPVSSLIVATLLADFVPGKTWFVLSIAMLSGYAALLRHALPVSQFFKSIQNEREENHPIN